MEENNHIMEEDRINGREPAPEGKPKQEKKPMGLASKIFAVIGIVLFLFVLYIIVDANKYRAMVRVIEGEGKVGINPTTESLDFGDLSRGTSAVRRVTVKNDSGLSVYVFTVKIGGISDLIKINGGSFTLAPGDGKEMEFTVYMPASAEKDKTYTGKVYLFRIPLIKR